MNSLKISNNMIRALLVLGLIVTAVSFRLMPHPPNFAPIAAIAIFGGAILPRKWALILPLTAMIASDLVLGLHSLVWFTWGSFLLIALLSSKYMNKINTVSVAGASFGASFLFFLVTNFGVWLEGRLYPPTFDGLLGSYINAIPFFRNTLLSDVVFSAMLFGAYVLVYRYALNRRDSLKLTTA